MSTTEKWIPQQVTALDRAFPAKVSHLMPPMDEIPEEFTNWNLHNKWQKLVTDWFFHGIELGKLTPKLGIDPEIALQHIGTIMSSFEPKHEHKEAACAYLLSLWFDNIEYTAKARSR